MDENEELLVVGIAGLLVIALGVLAFFWFTPDTRTGAITGHKWRNVIDIETFKQVRDGSWEHYVPGDAYNRNCYRKQDGTTCTTVNKVTVCTPTYDTWCDYTVDRWVKTREVVTKAEFRDDPAPWWGDPNLYHTELYGNEREGKRSEYRWFVVAASDSTTVCRVDQQRWESTNTGGAITLKKRKLFGWDCGSLRVQ